MSFICFYQSVNVAIFSVYLLIYTSRSISIDKAEAGSFPIELLKVTATVGYTEVGKMQLKFIYWFYGLHKKHDFRLFLRVTKTQNVYEMPWQIVLLYKQSQIWYWSAIYTNDWHVLTCICNTINFALEFLLAFCAWIM